MISVRPFDVSEGPDFLQLYRACLDHYGAGPSRPEVEAEILRELDAADGMSAALAWNDGRALGFAIWARVFPAGNGFGLYMKELYVTAGARGTGAGKALMRHVAGVAVATGAVRVEWGSFQPDAISFYDHLGAPRKDKLYFELSGDRLTGFAEGD